MNLRIKQENCLKCRGEFVISEKAGSPFFRTAYVANKSLVAKLTLPRQLGAAHTLLKIRNDETGDIIEYPLSFVSFDGLFDVYTVDFAIEKSGLYFCRVEFESAVGKAYTARDGYYGGVKFKLLDDCSPFEFQLTISEFSYSTPDWIYGGVIYHIFVDRFFRGKETPLRDDAILNDDWDNGIPEYPAYPGAFLRNNMFFGGNLYGIIEKLDYIASLGVNCIYLSPIFEAYSNHKYDTGNYLKIDDCFGGEDAFSELVKKADEKGIKIILDGVFNHTGADSIYFNKFGKYSSVGAYQSKDSPYYEWFDFQEFPEKYTCWWGIDILPRINRTNPSCRDYFIGDDGVIDHYARLGIGGMRLDVADELDDDFIKGIKKSLSKHIPSSILYGEVWEDASNKIAYDVRKKYYQGKELDGVMNYPLRTGIIRYLRYGDTEPLRYAVCDVMPNCPKRILDAQMNLLGTHDTVRIITALAAPDEDGRSNDELAVWRMDERQYNAGVQMLKNAYLILATLPGIPTVFYGDEVGMQGYSDPFNRLPFPWNNINSELLSFYQKIGEIRRKENIYKDAELKILRLDSEVFAFARIKKSVALVTVINRKNRDLKVEFNGKINVLYGDKVKNNTVAVNAYSGAIMKCSSQEKIKIDF